MKLNQPLVDWLTLTSFHYRDYAEWLNLAWIWPTGKLEDSRRLQYKGASVESLFVGEGRQQGKPHYMMQISGEAANVAAQQVAYEKRINCTRIDLQVTMALPPKWSSRKTYDEITNWEADGRKRKTSIVQSGDGNDTIYIGSRTSDRFTRLYVKPVVDGKVLRFEVEFKGAHAKSIWHAIATRTGTARDFLVGELKAMPDVENGTFTKFLTVLGYHGKKSKPKRAYADSGTLRWLREQVDPAIHRAMNDHESGATVRKLVRAWAAEADEIDNSLADE